MRTSFKTKVILFFSFIALWFIWLLCASSLSHRAYLRDGAPDTLVILAIAVLAGLVAVWHKAAQGFRKKFMFFCGAFLLVIVTLWNVPEAWVRLTAREVIDSEVAFNIGHPGPPYARNRHCEAGLRFYDEWLKRPVELCTRDAIVPPGSRSVQLVKRVTSRGAIFTHYRYVSAAGNPQGWWPVVHPSQ